MIWAATAVAGGIGAVARVLITARVDERFGAPRGTVIVNVLGTAALTYVVSSSLGSDARLVVGVGLLGGLTTFSTWMLDGLAMAVTHGFAAAALHVARVSAVAVLIAAVTLL